MSDYLMSREVKEQIERLTRELAEAREAHKRTLIENGETIHALRAYIRDIGHKPECAASIENICNTGEQGPCDCGYAELVNGETE